LDDPPGTRTQNPRIKSWTRALSISSIGGILTGKPAPRRPSRPQACAGLATGLATVTGGSVAPQVRSPNVGLKAIFTSLSLDGIRVPCCPLCAHYTLNIRTFEDVAVRERAGPWQAYVYSWQKRRPRTGWSRPRSWSSPQEGNDVEIVPSDACFGPEKGYPRWLLNGHQRADFLSVVANLFPTTVRSVLTNTALIDASAAFFADLETGGALLEGPFAAEITRWHVEWQLPDGWCAALPLALLECLDQGMPNMEFHHLLTWVLRSDAGAMTEEEKSYLPRQYDFGEAAKSIKSRADDFDSYRDLVTTEVDHFRQTLLGHLEAAPGAQASPRMLHRYRPSFSTHVEWAARYHVGLEGYGDIAVSAGVTEPAVRSAVKQIRLDLGLTGRSVIRGGGRPRKNVRSARTVRLDHWRVAEERAA